MSTPPSLPAVKFRVNWKFLALLVLATILLSGLTLYLHRVQVRRHAPDLLAQAATIDEQGRPERAARYLHRYVGLEPNDVDGLIQYARVLDKLAHSPKEKLVARGAYEQALAKDPHRHEIRRRVVRLAIEGGEIDRALPHLEALHEEFTEDGEVECLLALCRSAQGRPAEAEQLYRKGIEHDPTQVDGYAELAELLRERLDQPETADQVVTQMVANNPKAIRAYLFRAAYLQKYHKSLAKAADDVAAALALDPDDERVLLMASTLAQEQKRPEEARRHLRHGVTLHPKNVRLYLALADLESREKDNPAAIACLNQGLKELPRHPELLLRLGSFLVFEGDLTAARAVIQQLRTATAPPGQADLLEARALMKEGNWRAASEMLEDVRALVVRSPDTIQQVDLFLGECYSRLKDERALVAYRRAVNADPLNVRARHGLAAGLLAAGRSDDAVRELEQMMRLPEPPAEGWTLLTKAIVLRNLGAPGVRRSWDDANRYLELAAKAAPDSVEVPLLRAEVLTGEGKLAEARQLLEKELKGRDRIEFRAALAALAAREGKSEEVFRTLDAAAQALGDSAELRLARLNYLYLVPKDQQAPYVKKAAEGWEAFPPAERARVLRALARAYREVDDAKEAARLGEQLAGLEPGEAWPHLFLLDLAQQAGDAKAMQQVVESVRKSQGEGPLWHYAEARRLTLQARQGERGLLDQARVHAVEAIRRGGNTALLALCQADIAEQEEDEAAAIEHYQQALLLGDRQVIVIRRLVQLLSARQRFADADEAIRKLQEQAPLSTELQRLAAQVSLGKNDQARALDLAKKAVALDSKDPRELVWFSRLLWATGRRAEAEAPLRRAIELAPDIPEPWLALVAHQVRSGKPKEAEATIELARAKLPPRQAALTLALCYEVVGNKERAAEQYLAAAKAYPNDGEVLRAVADSLLRERQTAQALPYLRQLKDLRGKVSERDRTWARMALASCLASQGNYEQFQEALALVDKASSSEKRAAMEQLRARALVLGSHVGHRRDAIAAFHELAKLRPLSADEQFFLGRLYQVGGDWTKAREALQAAVGQNPKSPVYLTHLIRGLLDNQGLAEANIWLGRLQELQPNGIETMALQGRVLAAQGRGEEVLQLVKDYVGRKESIPADETMRLQLGAALLEELARDYPALGPTLNPRAEELYQKYIAKAGAKDLSSVLTLVGLYGRCNRLPEALKQLEDGWRRCPPEEAAAAGVNALLAGQATREHWQRLEPLIVGEFQKSPNSLKLLESLAVLREHQGRYDDAEEAYRKMLKLDGRNLFAMNNLAYLLALRGAKLAEASQLIAQGLTRTGPMAELLDTRALVHLAMGRADAAVKDLETAMDQKAMPPVTQFHLAWAYRDKGDQTGATQALQKAKDKGLNTGGLHPLERAVYEKMSKDNGG